MLIIREARMSDAPRLLEIYDYYVRYTAVSFECTTPTPEEFEARMRKTMVRYPYLVAEQDGRVVGYTYAGPFVGREAYRYSCELTIYLDRTQTGCGIGRRLYEALEAELRARGFLNLYACIGLPEEEDEYLTGNSADFHAHMGFRLAGTFHHCGTKFGRWYHMIWMEKLIGEHRTAAEELP